jgi:hypothetical protein
LADVSPEGCYGLASGDTKTNDGGHKEICLKSENVKEPGGGEVGTGKFTITISDGGAPVKTYHLTSSLTDGSGSHADFLFAEKAATLTNVGNADAYARENRGPIKDVIFYILADPELKGGDAIKSGEKAGSVTIDGKKHSLFKK